MAEPYTPDPADVDLATEATSAHYLVSNRTDADGHSPCVCGNWRDGDEDVSWDEHMAAVAVAALAAAGRLQPAGGATRTEWTWQHNRFVAEHEASPDRSRAERNAAACRAGFPDDFVAAVSRTIISYPNRSTLVGPWLPAPTDKEN